MVLPSNVSFFLRLFRKDRNQIPNRYFYVAIKQLLYESLKSDLCLKNVCKFQISFHNRPNVIFYFMMEAKMEATADKLESMV